MERGGQVSGLFPNAWEGKGSYAWWRKANILQQSWRSQSQGDGSARCPLPVQPEGPKDALCSSWPLAPLHLYGQPNAADIRDKDWRKCPALPCWETPPPLGSPGCKSHLLIHFSGGPQGSLTPCCTLLQKDRLFPRADFLSCLWDSAPSFPISH